MSKQSYSNHRRYEPRYNYLYGGLITCTLIGSMVNFYESIGNHERIYSASLLVAVTVIFAMGFFFYRGFALRAQDRAIRVEENFRHFILTGKPLDNRLGMRQIIALRFAPDEEFVTLAKEAAEKQLSSDEIKKSIKRWKGDYHRV